MPATDLAILIKTTIARPCRLTASATLVLAHPRRGGNGRGASKIGLARLSPTEGIQGQGRAETRRSTYGLRFCLC